MWAPPKENDTEAYDVEKKSAPPLIGGALA